MDLKSAVPKYNGGSITQYIKKVQEFEIKLKEEKYNLVLQFVNDWLDFPNEYKLKSLTEFKGMEQDELLKDAKHNRRILRRHSNKIVKKLNVTFNVDDDTASDEIKDNYILYFLSRSLTKIGYSLTMRKVDNKNYFTIKIK